MKAEEVNIEKLVISELDKREEIIDRLRGQLQNCVNHLDAATRVAGANYTAGMACIESANKALYETMDY